MALLLIVLAILAYFLGIIVKFHNRESTIEQNNADGKLIPADIVLLTMSLNIGNAMTPTSAFRHLTPDVLGLANKITPESLKFGAAFFLVLISIIVYCFMIFFGKRLIRLYQDKFFCDGKYLILQLLTQFIGFMFIVSTFLIAGC